MKKLLVILVGLLVSASAFATSIVDYTVLTSSVTTEVTAAIAGCIAVVALLWGARIGLNFAKRLMK